jgi:hypothetical protein
VKYARPGIRVVIQLTEPSTQAFPAQVGDTVFYPSEIRNALSASSLAVPGTNTLVSNLLTNISVDDLQLTGDHTWESEYADGMDIEAYIFVAPPSLAGMSFADAALAIYGQYHAILIAANVPLKDETKRGYRHHVLLNPAAYTLKTGTILYALASDGQFLLDLMNPQSIWNPIDTVRNIAGGLDEVVSIPHLRWGEKDHPDGEEEVPFQPIRDSEEVQIVEEEEDYGVLRRSLTASAIGAAEMKQISLLDSILKHVHTDWSEIYAITRVPIDFEDVCSLSSTHIHAHTLSLTLSSLSLSHPFLSLTLILSLRW